jgi:hypothetical protein
MRIAFALSLAVLAACKPPTEVAPGAPKSPPSGKEAFLPTRLDWAAVESQGVFASVLAAHGRREWVMVKPQPPNTLVVHLIPVDAVVNMPALQQEGTFLKSMWKPERDGWSPEIEVRIEPGGGASR